MPVQFLDVGDPAWPAALRRVKHDIYHRPDYVRLEARRLEAKPQACMVGDGERLCFIPYLIRHCASLGPESASPPLDLVSPYGYPGILLNDAAREGEFLRESLSALSEEWRRQGVCSAFFRMHPILGAGLPDLVPPGTFTDHGETVAIDLSLDEPVLWKQIRHGHRENINKCRKQGFAARFVPLAEVLDEFLAIYGQTMDRVHAEAAYYFDREYFRQLAELDQVHCCVIELGKTIAAACAFFETDGIVQAHLGGTLTEFLPKSPFLLALQQATLWAKSRGNRWLHLGGGVGGRQDELLRFKTGFSPLRFRFQTVRLILDAALYRRLVERRARDLNIPPETLRTSSYFPAYRSDG